MPLYEYICNDCDHQFTAQHSIKEIDTETPCPSCATVNTKRVVSLVGVVFKGDGWASKDFRVKTQMTKRQEKISEKQTERSKEQPYVKLLPNVEGERVGSWKEAKDLASSKGKDTSSYDSYIRKENS